jgi:fatty acid synthase
MAHNDYDLPIIEDGVIICHNAVVFCHLGSYQKDGQLIMHQGRATFGKNSILGARCATLPGFNLPAGSSLAALQLGRHAS